jgi:hypothetical protein
VTEVQVGTPWPGDIGLDFAAVTDGLELVRVRQVDPDTGETTATAYPVTALAGDAVEENAGTEGGEVAGIESGFTLRASDVGFVPRERDRIVDAAGVTWSIDSVSVEGRGSLYVCDATRMR